MKTCTFGPNTQKFSLKKFLILFPKKTRPGKVLLYFLKRKLFLYFQEWTLHFSAQVKKKKRSHLEKTSHTSGNRSAKESFSCTSGNFLYFRK